MTTQVFYIPKTLQVCFYKADKEFSFIQCFSRWQHDRFIPLKMFTDIHSCIIASHYTPSLPYTRYDKILYQLFETTVSENIPSYKTFSKSCAVVLRVPSSVPSVIWVGVLRVFNSGKVWSWNHIPELLLVISFCWPSHHTVR
jgi:hypothetical protein